ncbi:MAG: hypothetical protein IKB23_05445 [Clostridia bacterium]|nr:hypothetical protein [Clostridia bacterium]
MNKKEKAQLLFERMGLIDDRFIDEAASYVPKRAAVRIKFPVIRALAACLSVLLVFGIGIMMFGDKAPSGNNSQPNNESLPQILTVSSILKKGATPYRLVDPSKLDLLDGESRIIWQDTESGEYYQVKISASQQNELHYLNLPAENVTEADGDYRIWFVNASGEVSSPELKKSSGNVSFGSLFTYDPELELTDAFLERLDTLIN